MATGVGCDALGIVGMRLNTVAYAPTQAAWGGARPLTAYMAICLVAFVAGLWMTQRRWREMAGPRLAA